MAELTPEQRAAQWQAGQLDAEAYNAELEAHPGRDLGVGRLLIRIGLWNGLVGVLLLLLNFSTAASYFLSITAFLILPVVIGRIVLAIHRRPPPPQDVIYTGPRGGRYRINSNGRKSYDV